MLRSTDWVLERVRYAIKSFTLVNLLSEVFAETTADDFIVEFVANDDEYEEDVELEKFLRRLFTFLLLDGVTGVLEFSSSVSSSVVLFTLSKIFSNRFRGALLPLLLA
jgi:hypothetical protein